jgi:Fe2+ or Zn2+ uptake regulation protein
VPRSRVLFERHFDEGQAGYEVAGEHHHDHFICERCGKIIEFAMMPLSRDLRRAGLLAG